MITTSFLLFAVEIPQLRLGGFDVEYINTVSGSFRRGEGRFEKTTGVLGGYCCNN